jgi:peptidoglycan/LPS O-acetylase OafA/YrhL
MNIAVVESEERESKGLPAKLGGRIPELDGIRGIAIAMVLVYHYFLLPLHSQPGTLSSYIQGTGRLAWSGVDLFFVLSGFLIGGILLDARDSSNYFRVFYARRFFRIVPMYTLILVGAFLLSRLESVGIAGRFAFMNEGKLPWLPYVAFLQNFWMAAKDTLGYSSLTVTWSLAVEEQFYLTLPILVRLLSPRHLVAVLVGGILAAPTLRVLFHALWPTHIYSWVVMMPCRADALLLGVAGAIVLRNPRWRKQLEKNRHFLPYVLALLAVGVGLLTLLSPSPYGFGMLSVGFTWLALFYLTILLCALLYCESWLGRCLRWSWLGWLGTIAYGTYLLHPTILIFASRLVWPRVLETDRFSDLWVSVVALFITLGLCRLSWQYFEKPLVQLGHGLKYDGGGISRATPTMAAVKTSVS